MKRDIDELLSAADQLIAQIAGEYERALTQRDVSSISKVAVKMTLEQLRSALDYVAVAVDNVVYDGANRNADKKIYFPYAENKVGVEKSLKRQYGDLERRAPMLYRQFHKVQVYEQGSDWLQAMCKLTNVNKHHQLPAQSKTSLAAGLAVGNLFRIGPNDRVEFHNSKINGITIGVNGRARFRGDMTEEQARQQLGPQLAGIFGLRIAKVGGGYSFKPTGIDWDILELLKKARAEVGNITTTFAEELSRFQQNRS